jgi:hypothetical protein
MLSSSEPHAEVMQATTRTVSTAMNQRVEQSSAGCGLPSAPRAGALGETGLFECSAA